MDMPTEIAQSWFAMGTQYNAMQLDPTLPGLPVDDEVYETANNMFLRGYVHAGLANGSITMDNDKLLTLAIGALAQFKAAEAASKLQVVSANGERVR